MELNMNDFTKEELQYLYRAIYERPNTVTEEMDMMREKLQSMIDNYCEHIPSDNHYEQFRWQLCSKCGEQYK